MDRRAVSSLLDCGKQLRPTDDFFLDDGASYHPGCIERVDREDAARPGTGPASATPPTSRRVAQR
jgi:hypothetical protein